MYALTWVVVLGTGCLLFLLVAFEYSRRAEAKRYLYFLWPVLSQPLLSFFLLFLFDRIDNFRLFLLLFLIPEPCFIAQEADIGRSGILGFIKIRVAEIVTPWARNSVFFKLAAIIGIFILFL